MEKAEQAIQASINSGKPVSIGFDIDVYSHLMRRAMGYKDLVRMRITEFTGVSFDGCWTIKMPAL